MHFVFYIYACYLVNFFYLSPFLSVESFTYFKSDDLCVSLFLQSDLSCQRPDSTTEVTDVESHAKLCLSLKNPY